MSATDRVSAAAAPLSVVQLRLLALGSSFVAVVIALVLAFLLFGDFLQASNVREPWHSNQADYFAGVAGAFVFAVLLLYAPLAGDHRVALLVLWATKSAVTLGLMLVYEAQYELLDAYYYHELAVNSSVHFGDFKWGDGTELIIWFLQFIYAFVPPSYHLAKVLFSFAGLIGIYITWRAVVAFTRKKSLHYFFLLGLFPSLLFWSSILGKESVLILLVGIFVLGIARLHQNRYLSGLFLAFVAAALASLVRLWMGAILAAPTLVMLLMWRGGIRKPTALALAAAATAITTVLLGVAIERFGGDVAGLVQSVDNISRAWEEGGAAQSAPEFGSLRNVVTFAPLGAFTALFRPLPGEVGGLFGLAAGIENALLLFAFALSLCKLRLQHLANSSLLILGGVLLMWAAIYGFVSYQNLGTASRFKAQILPVMLPLIIVLWQRSPRNQRWVSVGGVDH